MNSVQVEQTSYEMPPREGFTIAHFLTVADIDRSARFYETVFGGRILSGGNSSGAPGVIQIANTWLIVNIGGGPTPDKPSATLSVPADPDAISSFMNIRVADIQTYYELWRKRGAEFITEPKDKYGETRCYIRDPDGYIVEVGQSKPELGAVTLENKRGGDSQGAPPAGASSRLGLLSGAQPALLDVFPLRSEDTTGAAQKSVERATQTPGAGMVDLKLEVVVMPVADVERAKRFYGSLGWRLDADFAFDNGFRVVQFTPTGSGCSVQFGTKITSAAPGSAQGLYLVVSEIAAARDELAARGAAISEVFHPTAPGAQFRRDSTSGQASGPSPDHASYGSFATFSDPDGNSWLLQEVKARLPGRGLGNSDVATLTELLQEAEEHHGAYEPTAPKHHWSDWYAAYIVARERGSDPEDAAKGAALHVEGAGR